MIEKNKFRRLKKSYRSINMNDNVQNYIINNDNRFNNKYIEIAKKILQKIRIIPTYERVLDLSQNIKDGLFEDLPEFNDNNINLYVDRTMDVLKNKKVLLSNKTYTFEELKQEQIKYDHYFFDNDPRYNNSKFELISLNISEINNNISLTDYELEELNIFLEYGYCDDSFMEEVGEIILLIKDNYELNPIIINKNNEIIDGFHRIYAYLYLNINNIYAYKEI